MAPADSARRARRRADPLRAAAARAPESPAVVGARTWSYLELDRWCDDLAGALVRAGVRPGDRVGMCLPPTPEAVALLHAALRAGGVLVPLNPGWTEVEIAGGLAAAGTPALLFRRTREVGELCGDPSPPAAEQEIPLPRLRRGPGPAAILLTSGSTGAPRPIPLSHDNLMASAEGAIRRLRLSPRDRWLASLSPGHVGGLALLHRVAVIGCSLLTQPRFDAREVARRIDAGSFSHASLVPVMLQRILEVRGDRPAPPSLRCVLLGGAPAAPRLLDRALALGYPLALTYGLTEATSQVATAPPERVRAKPGTVGKPLPGVEIRIEEPVSDGVGEILVRGPTVATGAPLGAGRRSEAAPSVFLDGDGWLHTGDLGRLDEEGDLWVAGRLSDRIVTGGVTVEPAEVEAAVSSHPDVREAAAFGVPDPEWGERIVVAVVPERRARPPSLEELIECARERLGSAKLPRELRIVESLPRNAAGKVERYRLASEVPPRF